MTSICQGVRFVVTAKYQGSQSISQLARKPSSATLVNPLVKGPLHLPVIYLGLVSALAKFPLLPLSPCWLIAKKRKLHFILTSFKKSFLKKQMIRA